jgi:hypothetical protein
MNFEDALKAGGASATIIAIVGIVFKVVQSFCGHRIRSECCGHTATAGVSVENIPPVAVEVPPSARVSPIIAPAPAPVAPAPIAV